MAGTSDRSSGVLLHVSSLPGPYGIGDLGPEARRWIDWLAGSGTRFWQVLPLGPPGAGNSPYSSYYSHAGSPDLISPDDLVGEGLLSRDEVKPLDAGPTVSYDRARAAKMRWLEQALGGLRGEARKEFNEFRDENRDWLGPYERFMAIKDMTGGVAWTKWPAAVFSHDEIGARAAVHAFGQYVFVCQLSRLREYAADRGVEIIGDVPLYVAADSVDVWQRPELFTVGADGEPTHVAGVPPDDYSATGQRSGSPLYRWHIHEAEDFAWWSDRLARFFQHADVLRIDHFIGLVRYFDIPADLPTSKGKWRPGPGRAFFDSVLGRLDEPRLILEDLGIVTSRVKRLRKELGFPGMVVLQDLLASRRRPRIEENRIAYTGTHDNDTAAGRFLSADKTYRKRALSFTGGEEGSFAWDLVTRCWESPARVAIAPMQDLLGLDSSARMNYPSTPEGNWEWRLGAGDAGEALASRLGELNGVTGRSHRRDASLERTERPAL